MRHEVKHLFVGKKERMWMTEVIIGNRAARVLVLGTSTSHQPQARRWSRPRHIVVVLRILIEIVTLPHISSYLSEV